jgi:hypothetical protein
MTDQEVRAEATVDLKGCVEIMRTLVALLSTALGFTTAELSPTHGGSLTVHISLCTSPTDLPIRTFFNGHEAFILPRDLVGLVYFRFEDSCGFYRFCFYLCNIVAELGRRPKSVQL